MIDSAMPEKASEADWVPLITPISDWPMSPRA